MLNENMNCKGKEINWFHMFKLIAKTSYQENQRSAPKYTQCDTHRRGVI